MEWVKAFSAGLRDTFKKWNIYLIGGDNPFSEAHYVVNDHGLTKRLCCGVAAGAEGDALWVTGTLGDAAYGFHHPDNAFALEVLRRPEPPVEFGAALSAIGAVHP